MNKTAFTAGVATWTLGEYALHRWLLHGPGLKWHLQHHAKPTGEGFDWKPAFVAGVVFGYVVYSYFHHLLHRYEFPWKRSTEHDLHHQDPRYNYGVTTSLWDRVFGTFGGK